MVQAIELQHATGNQEIDALLRGVVSAFEADFPGRSLGYFLIGSYADGSAVATSDLDVMLVFRGTVGESELAQAVAIAGDIAAKTPVPLDVDVTTEAMLLTGRAPLEAVRLRTTGVAIYGPDLRATLPLPTLAVYRRLVTPAPYINFVQLIRGRARIHYPLTYPNPDGEFFGYDAFRSANRYSPTGRGLKDLANGVGWAATALVALQSGKYLAGKGRVLKGYQADIGDEWAGFLAEVFALCRTQWAYHVPADRADRALLRALCGRVLAFENHYFARYRDFLLAELQGSDMQGPIFAAERLREVLYADRAVHDKLARQVRTGEPALRAAASETLLLLR